MAVFGNGNRRIPILGFLSDRNQDAVAEISDLLVDQQLRSVEWGIAATAGIAVMALAMLPFLLGIWIEAFQQPVIFWSIAVPCWGAFLAFTLYYIYRILYYPIFYLIVIPVVFIFTLLFGNGETPQPTVRCTPKKYIPPTVKRPAPLTPVAYTQPTLTPTVKKQTPPAAREPITKDNYTGSIILLS